MFIAIPIISITAVLTLQFAKPTFLHGSYYCTAVNEYFPYRTILRMAAYLLTALGLFVSSIYPAMKTRTASTQVKYDTSQNDIIEINVAETTDESSCVKVLMQNINIFGNVASSPIQYAIRRLFYGSALILLFGTLSSVSMILLPSGSPVVIRCVPLLAAGFVQILGMQLILGNLKRVYLSCIPSCK